MKRNSVLLFLATVLAAGLATAQAPFCNVTAVPPVLHAEGLAERVGDVVLICTAQPNAQFTGNFTFVLSATVTNRLSGANTVTGVVFSIDSGAGPQPTLVQPILANQSSIAYNGVLITFSPQGTAKLTIAGIRVNASQVAIDAPITELISVNAAPFTLSNQSLVVGHAERGLYVGMLDTLVCAQNGSRLPDIITFSNLLARGTAFASTRVTEGFADSFGPKSGPDYFMADSGQRIIVRYGGFPSDARLFVPDVIAGSNATQPTAGGDFEIPAAGGMYTPSVSGSLLLARVPGAASNGAGGTPVYLPGPVGSGTMAFDTVGELTITNGTAFVVYEVVDANPSALETAQFPTFLGLAPSGTRNPSTTAETVLLAPQSIATFASASEPIPRFDALPPLSDCSFLSDCTFLQGTLAVDTTPLLFSEPQFGPTGQQYFTLKNTAGGFMSWTTSITYSKGAGWLSLDPVSGVNATTVRVYAAPGSLTPDTYQATIKVDGGSAGTAFVAVTLIVTQPAGSNAPQITAVLNTASQVAVPAVPGSLVTVLGSRFSGNKVSAAFAASVNNAPLTSTPVATLTGTDTLLVLMVPNGVPMGAAQLTVTVDGVASTPFAVQVAPFAPAIFPGALLNQDGSLNAATNSEARGNQISFYATGLSGTGAVSVFIGNVEIDQVTAGPAAGAPGLQLVSLTIPLSVHPGTDNLFVCGAASGQAQACSTQIQITVR